MWVIRPVVWNKCPCNWPEATGFGCILDRVFGVGFWVVSFKFGGVVVFVVGLWVWVWNFGAGGEICWWCRGKVWGRDSENLGRGICIVEVWFGEWSFRKAHSSSKDKIFGTARGSHSSILRSHFRFFSTDPFFSSFQIGFMHASWLLGFIAFLRSCFAWKHID